MESRRQYLVEKASELLRLRGMKPSRLEQPLESVCPDAVFRSYSSELFVECKAMNLYRAPDFRAAIGDAILRFQHAKQAAPNANSQLMLAFLFQRISRKAQNDLVEYSAKYLPGLHWIILAEDGSGISRIDEQNQNVSVSPFRNAAHREYGPGRASLFSPNNQWLFKVLMLSGIDPQYFGGPASKPLGISELAKVADVPQPSVSAFIIKAEKEGYIKRARQGFVIQQHEELLDDWAHALKNKMPRAVGLKYLYPDESEEIFLQRLHSYCQNRQERIERPAVVVGGPLGCHLLGLGRSNIRHARLYSDGSLKDIMSSLNLVEEPLQSAPLSIIVSPNNEAVFRCAVNVKGIPVCDVLQCYFDVRFSYARGKEQADYLFERILKPCFEKRN